MTFRFVAGAVIALITGTFPLLARSSATVAATSIQAGEYCILSEAQTFGRTLPIQSQLSSCRQWNPLPGSFGARSASVSFSPPEVSSLPPGVHTLYLRFRDDLGVWGPARMLHFTVRNCSKIN